MINHSDIYKALEGKFFIDSKSIAKARERIDEVNKATTIGGCWICEKELKKYEARIDRGRAYCQECFKKKKQEDAFRMKTYRLAKAWNMKEAVYALYNQQMLIPWEYREAIESCCASAAEGRSRFDSVYEMATAAMIIAHHLHVKTQVRVGRCRMDMFIPEMGVYLEVDGERHTPDRDIKRDIELFDQIDRNEVILHLPCLYVQTNLENLVPNISNAKSRYQEVARKHNYKIPYETYKALVRMKEIWNKK